MDLIDNIGDACNVYLILIDKLIYTHDFFGGWGGGWGGVEGHLFRFDLCSLHAWPVILSHKK